MSKNSQQAELLGPFNQTRGVIDTFLQSRSEADKVEIGTPEQWAAKDVLTNVAFWMEYMVERMEYVVRDEPLPRGVDFGALEQKAFAVYQHRPWQEVVGYAEHSLDSLIAEVERFTDAQLNTYNTYGDDNGGPLWGEIRANGFISPLQVLEKFYTRKGDQVRAAAINAMLLQVVDEPVKIVVDLINPQMLRKQQEAGGGPLVIDVRSPKEYAAGHIQGAVNIPAGELSKKLAHIPQNQAVVTYCNMHHPGESRGERAAALLREKGYQVQALVGGYPNWKEAGLPIEEMSQG